MCTRPEGGRVQVSCWCLAVAAGVARLQVGPWWCCRVLLVLRRSDGGAISAWSGCGCKEGEEKRWAAVALGEISLGLGKEIRLGFLV